MEELAPEGQRAIHATVPPIRCLVARKLSACRSWIWCIMAVTQSPSAPSSPRSLICGLLGAVSQARRCCDIVTNCHDGTVHPIHPAYQFVA